MSDLSLAASASRARNPLRVRTITAGVELGANPQLQPLEQALQFLTYAKRAYEDQGYEVQTIRIATDPWLGSARGREQLLTRLRSMDELIASHGAHLSIGPVITEDRADPELAAWASELLRTTREISFSVTIDSPERGVHAATAETAARVITSLARARAGGVANFRFAAAANIPAGTPFFPVAWHRGPQSVAIGVESASLAEEAFTGGEGFEAATAKLRALLDERLAPIDRIASALARDHGRAYLGIDTSPAPGKDRSIAAAIERLTGQPFGSAGTLQACASITAALKSVSVRTCGYSGLMLPVLEDPLLAQRAGERRYTIRDLLLYSSVCGTGLDVAPISGDTPVAVIGGLLRDVAALSVRLSKPLSARLFVVPDKGVGEIVRFSDRWLTDCAVMPLD